MEKQEYAERLKFEHELINRRVTWLMASQSILFAAYGAAFDNPKATQLLNTLSVIGAASAILVLVGILAAFAAKYLTWQELKGNPAYKDEPFWVNTKITFIGFIPDFALPLVFAIGWWFLYCLAP